MRCPQNAAPGGVATRIEGGLSAPSPSTALRPGAGPRPYLPARLLLAVKQRIRRDHRCVTRAAPATLADPVHHVANTPPGRPPPSDPGQRSPTAATTRRLEIPAPGVQLGASFPCLHNYVVVFHGVLNPAPWPPACGSRTGWDVPVRNALVPGHDHVAEAEVLRPPFGRKKAMNHGADDWQPGRRSRARHARARAARCLLSC